MENIDLRPKHLMRVPGLGVFIAPNAVGQLFQLHDYTRCPNLRKTVKRKRVLYPILRPNVMHSPRYYHLQQPACMKREYYRENSKGSVRQELLERVGSQRFLWIRR